MLYGIFLSIVSCFCWGSASFMMRGIKELDAAEMSVTRAAGGLISASLLFFFIMGRHLTPVTTQEASLFFAMVLINNIIGDVCLFYSIHHLGIAAGSAVSNSYPIWVAALSFVIYNEPLTPAIAAGTLLVVAGVALLCLGKGGKGRISLRGLAAAIAASIFWAVGLLLYKQLLLCGLEPLMIVLGRAVSFFVLAFIMWFSREFFIKKKAHALQALQKKDTVIGLSAGLCNVAFAWFYLLTLQKVPVTVATPICAANPVIASLLSMLVYKDRITVMQWAGIFFAVGGTILVAM